jgi:hypothetical protein
LYIAKKRDAKNFPYSGSNSTQVYLLATCPGKQILGVDPSSKVSELKDDKGTSLLGTGFFRPTFNTYGQIARDRGSMIVSLATSEAPAKGATTITLKGNLVLRSGTDEKTTDEAELELKEKAEVKVDTFTLKVVSEKGFGGNGATINVLSTAPNIKAITVKDADGKTVEVMSSPGFGFGKSWTSSVTWFSKEEKVSVPVDLTFGVGL